MNYYICCCKVSRHSFLYKQPGELTKPSDWPRCVVTSRPPRQRRPLLASQAARQLQSSAARAALLQISDRDEFHQRVILSPIPVIVNFHADWCEPCKDLTPMLERLIESKSNIYLCSVSFRLLAVYSWE